MKSIVRYLALALVLSGALFATVGCQSSVEDSTVPWSRPAEWEGRLPGMGGGL